MKNKGPLKVLNGTKLNLDDHGNNLESFRISLESFRSFRSPLLYKPVTGQELFFAVSYSKPALESIPISVVCGRCNIGSVRVSARNDRKWKKMKAIMYLPKEQLGEIIHTGEFVFDHDETW